MARLFDDVDEDHFQLGTGVVTAVPISMSAWFRSNDTGATQTIMGVFEGAGNPGDRFYLNAWSDGNVYYTARGASGSFDYSIGTYSANQWHHVAAVSASASDHHGYLDGSETTDATNIGTLTITDTLIGARRVNFIRSIYMSGDIAEVTFWDVALTDAEVVALAGGANPLRFRNSNIQAYYPLLAISGNAIDFSGGANELTENNGVAQSVSHPPVQPQFGFGSLTPVSLAAAVDLSHVAALADSFDNVVQRRPIRVTNF
jgi:hypothetical protein